MRATYDEFDDDGKSFRHEHTVEVRLVEGKKKWYFEIILPVNIKTNKRYKAVYLGVGRVIQMLGSDKIAGGSD